MLLEQEPQSKPETPPANIPTIVYGIRGLTGPAGFRVSAQNRNCPYFTFDVPPMAASRVSDLYDAILSIYPGATEELSFDPDPSDMHSQPQNRVEISSQDGGLELVIEKPFKDNFVYRVTLNAPSSYAEQIRSAIAQFLTPTNTSKHLWLRS